MALEICGTQADGRGREVKEHGTVLLPAACYEDRLDERAVPWHWHDEWEAAVVAEGTALVRADGETHTLKTGQGIFLNASALHSLEDGGGSGCRIRSVVFHPRLVGGGMDSVFW